MADIYIFFIFIFLNFIFVFTVLETHDEILNSFFTIVAQNKSSTTDLQVTRREPCQKPG